MGADIHVCVETQNEQGVWKHDSDVDVLSDRNYGIFGFLANVRNYSQVPPLSEPRGVPVDVSEATFEELNSWSTDAHSTSYLLFSELLAFDYDQLFENRRQRIGSNSWSGVTVPVGSGEMMSYREFLTKWFFHEFETLSALGPPEKTRIVFWFDN